MSALARTVGISRQALYLHFPDRAQLLLALVTDIDEKEQLQAGRAAVQQAADAAGAIRAWARHAGLAQPQDRRPRPGPWTTPGTPTRAAAAAWADRTGNRMRGAISIIERLRARRTARPQPATITEAAALLWELTSFGVWDDLVNDARIAPDRYVEIITAAVLGTPSAHPSRRRPARKMRRASRIS